MYTYVHIYIQISVHTHIYIGLQLHTRVPTGSHGTNFVVHKAINKNVKKVFKYHVFSQWNNLSVLSTSFLQVNYE